MAFPLNQTEAGYILNRRFGLRVGANPADAIGGAAYALDEGGAINQPYINWDGHLNNTIWKIQGFDNSRNSFLLFISPVNASAERYNLYLEGVGIGDQQTFPKANAIGSQAVTIHAHTQIGTKAIVTLMEWVFQCVQSFGP